MITHKEIKRAGIKWTITLLSTNQGFLDKCVRVMGEVLARIGKKVKEVEWSNLSIEQETVWRDND